MIDARQIFADLQQQAETIARDLNVDQGLADARTAAGKVRERLETDPQARTVAAGAGGLLLLGLLGSRGGRNLIGGIAKTGAVAALGALAYKAWTDRQRGGADSASPQDAEKAGFLIEADKDPEFALAVVHAMLASAYADGALDKRERLAVEAALIRAGASDEDRRALMNDLPETERFDAIARAARTPNHAAELFAAAVVTAGENAREHAGFFERLADRLGIHPGHAAAIMREAGA
ncbi:MAG: DUF533 domain-containing protein [Amphiplicatus sp.]